MRNVTLEEVFKEIKKLYFSKAVQETDISTKIMKENAYIFVNFICQSFSNLIVTFNFLAVLKLANNTHVFKKASKNSKENWRLEGISPNVSKIHERLLFKQINCYFEGVFSKYHCGF